MNKMGKLSILLLFFDHWMIKNFEANSINSLPKLMKQKCSNSPILLKRDWIRCYIGRFRSFDMSFTLYYMIEAISVGRNWIMSPLVHQWVIFIIYKIWVIWYVETYWPPLFYRYDSYVMNNSLQVMKYIGCF